MLAGLGLVVVAVGALAGGPRPFGARSPASVQPGTGQPSVPIDAATLTPTPSGSAPSGAADKFAGGLALLVVALVAAVLVVVLLVVRSAVLDRGRRERGARTRDQLPPGVAPPPAQDRLAAALDRDLDDLARGPVSDAIVGCWLQVEASAAEAGAERRAADTSVEFAERVVAAYGVRAEALLRLGALYREARFSTHPMPESARAEAGRCLRAVREDLRVKG